VRWAGGRRSDNVEDRRGMGGGRIAIGGGVGGLIVLVLALLFGADPRALLRQMQTDTAQEAPSQPGAPAPGVPDQSREFISVVLAETEDVWREQFQKMGRQYADPKLVLFSDEVESACGVAGAAVGPFYCPEDDQIYLDLSFFEQLDQLGGPGDFAQAYVVAHEVGHHVQDLLGITDQVQAMQQQMSRREANQLSVRVELQADFFAGVWAHYTERMSGVVEPGDIAEALQAASAIGDDRLQRRSQGHVVPDAFTHGTSEQRVAWFRRGYETGDPSQGDTFAAGATP
jgi:predicted metalloprotease